MEQTNQPPYPTRTTQSLQISSLNQPLQAEQNNLLSNPTLDKNNETYIPSIQFDPINDKSNKHTQSFLKDNTYSFSSSSNSTWTNTVNNFNYSGVRNENNNQSTNTLGTTGQIAGIKRSNNIIGTPG
jgi:hypothetical protein